MLLGEHRCVLDEKGRLNFPAKFREEMGEQFIVTKWLDGCIIAFPNDEWDRIRALLKEKDMVNSRNVRRFLYAGAGVAAPDRQGRVLLPVPLREHASLQKDVMVIGVDWYAEIWDAAAWKQAALGLDEGGAIADAMVEIQF